MTTNFAMAASSIAPGPTTPVYLVEPTSDRMIDRPKTPAGLAPASSWRQINGPLFRKYVAILLAVVCVVLLINALLEAGFVYQEHKVSLIRIQREQAEAA